MKKKKIVQLVSVRTLWLKPSDKNLRTQPIDRERTKLDSRISSNIFDFDIRFAKKFDCGVICDNWLLQLSLTSGITRQVVAVKPHHLTTKISIPWKILLTIRIIYICEQKKIFFISLQLQSFKICQGEVSVGASCYQGYRFIPSRWPGLFIQG